MLRSLLAVAGALAVYAVVPVPGGRAPQPVGWLGFVAGVVAFTIAVTTLAVRAQGAPDSGGGVGVDLLAMLLYSVLVFFSLTYLAMVNRPGQFSGLNDRVDAMYFTVTTLSTVGYGDVHATGETARVVVTVQLFFDLLVLGVAARLLGPAIARAAIERQRLRRAPEADSEPETGQITPQG